MKRILFAGMLMAGLTAQAQETFLNERMANSGNDVYGTSRYVGMGGAMGALGADLSCMSYNPAGIALYRRSDIGFTTGAIWNADKVDRVKNARGTLDQFGIVYAARTGNPKMPFFNMGFNYQKKKNFGGAFIADNNNLKGLSQMDQLAELVNAGYDTDYNLAGAAKDYQFLSETAIPGSGKYYFNKYNGELNRYTHSQWGGLSSFDLNMSANVNDRVYLGITAGFESMKYRAETDYYEESSVDDGGTLKYGDYSLYNDYQIDGWGFNLKLGMIVRPFEERPFRVGLAFETPSWYQLNSSTMYQLTDCVDNVTYPNYQDHKRESDESYLEYAMHTPVKGRLSMGSSVGNYLLWDVDYEFANYGKMSMGYPRNYNAQLFDTDPDYAMKDHAAANLHFQHSVRAGIEAKASPNLTFRLGYNFISSPYNKEVSLDQWSIDSNAMNYQTSTSYMRMGNTNIITLGMGYKYKKFYADLAYKLRGQKADFYAFDCNFTNADSDFSADNPGLSGVKIEPVEANMTRHQLTATLGFKF